MRISAWRGLGERRPLIRETRVLVIPPPRRSFNSMNIALWFSYTKELLEQRDRLQKRVEQLESEQKAFVDAIARNAGKPEVFNRPEPPKPSQVPVVAFGPTMSAQRQKAKAEEGEIIKRAEEARRNGHPVEIPEIP